MRYKIIKTKERYEIKDNEDSIVAKLNYYDYKLKKFDWILVANVQTSKKYRRQGFASTLLKELYKDIPKDKGLYLFVKKNNYKAINLYKKLGFKHIRDYRLKDGEYLIMAKGNALISQFDKMNFK
jgi:predicted GNAT family acetyltransferase